MQAIGPFIICAIKIKTINSIVMLLLLLDGICVAENSKPNIVIILTDDQGYF